MITALSPVSTHGTPQIHCSTHLCTMQFCCYHLLSLCRWHSMSAICNTLTCRGMTVHQQPLTKELFNHSCVTALLGPIRSTLNHNWDCAYANNWLSISFSYKMVLEYRQPCSLDIRDFAGHHTTRHSCLLLLYTHTHTHDNNSKFWICRTLGKFSYYVHNQNGPGLCMLFSISKKKGKGEVVPVHTMKAYWGVQHSSSLS